MSKFIKIIIGILAILGVLGIVAGIFVFFIISKVDYKYTGEQLFTAINQFRQERGLHPIEQDLKLCDNLVERWLAIKEPSNGHKGFEEWMNGEGLTRDGKLIPEYSLIGELYATASTPENAIAFWEGSTGHKLTLEKPEFNVGCVYANDGTGVVIMAQKVKSQ